MSHLKERKEKNCLNCGTTLTGRYCHKCGQENVVTKETFWSLTKHFIYDILHFEGNFLYTIRILFSKPGEAAKEYISGKRIRFLNPIRMYLSTSAIFFLLFLSFKSLEFINIRDTKFINVQKAQGSEIPNKERMELADSFSRKLKADPANPALQQQIKALRDTSNKLTYDQLIRIDSLGIFTNYRSKEEYDSVQKKLSKNRRDGWLRRMITLKNFRLNQRYGTNKEEEIKAFAEIFLHQLQYLLFVSLPFFALILKLLYVRRKQFYFSDHAVFTLYHYVISFIILFAIILLNYMDTLLHVKVIQWINGLLIFSLPLYMYLSMKRFYNQGAGKTFAKFLILTFLGMVLLIILFIVFLLFSVLQM